MKPVFLCVLFFLLAIVNSFSQIVQKKQTTAPIIKKTEPKKTNTPQPKAIGINPATSQEKFLDSSNAKINSAIIELQYSSSFPLKGYKPQVDLFDENNHHVAHWDINTNEIQSKKDMYDKVITVLQMKVDNDPPSFGTLENGLRLKFHIEGITYDPNNPMTHNDTINHEMSILSLSLIVKFAVPPFEFNMYGLDYGQGGVIKFFTLNDQYWDLNFQWDPMDRVFRNR